MMALVLAEQGKILQSDVPQLSQTDAEITAALKPLKNRFRFEYDQNKHGTHLSNYLGTPFLMNEMYPESFPQLRDAKRWQEFYFSTVAAKVRAWQTATLDRANRECKLRNPFTYEMPFWSVYQWDSRRKGWTLGDDAKSAIAFLPRDTGAAMLKEALLRIAPRTLPGELVASTHDSVLCDAVEGRTEALAGILREEMERPVPELGGLVIPVELKVGQSWHESTMEAYEALVTT